jgi:hypothetical protein
MTDTDRIIEEARKETMPFESWEKLPDETAPAFSAFCIYRDYGTDRSIRKVIETVKKDERERAKCYGVWRGWASKFRWKERTADYDRYIEKLKQTEIRKTIEAQGEMHREVTGKMLGVVKKKLDTMNPEELTQGNVTEWVATAIKADREAAGLVAANGKPEVKQGELNFVTEFTGL